MTDPTLLVPIRDKVDKEVEEEETVVAVKLEEEVDLEVAKTEAEVVSKLEEETDQKLEAMTERMQMEIH